MTDPYLRNISVSKLIIVLTALVLLTILSSLIFREVKKQSAISRAIRLKHEYFVRARQQLHLQENVDPIAFIAQKLEAQKTQRIAPEDLDKYLPAFNRVESLRDPNGQIRAKTYYFLPQEIDKHLFMGFWLTVRFSQDGTISSVTMED